MVLEAMHLEEILDALSSMKGWSELNQEFITKTFHFLDFDEAFEFVKKISLISQAQHHHPRIVLEFGKVKVELSTNDVNGLTQKDFDLAKLIDEVFEDNR